MIFLQIEVLVLRGLGGRQEGNVLLSGVDGNDNEDHTHKQTQHCGAPEPRLSTHAVPHIACAESE